MLPLFLSDPGFPNLRLELPDEYWTGEGMDLPSALLPTLGMVPLQSDGTNISLAPGASPRGGQAFVFSGSQGTASLHLPGFARFLTPPFTIALWLRVDSIGVITDTDRAIIGTGDGSRSTTFKAQGTSLISGNAWDLTSVNNSGGATGNSIPVTQWGWCVLRSISGGFEWIINANFAASNPNMIGTGDPSDIIFGASSPLIGLRPLAGAVADIAGWNKSLSNQAIAVAYEWIKQAPFAKRSTGNIIGSASGTFTLLGEVEDMAKSAVVHRTTNQATADGALTALSFDTEVLDTGNFFDPLSPTRFTISITGNYIVTGTVYWGSIGGGIRQLSLQKNGGPTNQVGVAAVANVSTLAYTKVAETINFIAGDYIEFIVYQNSGTTQNAQVDDENAIIAGITGPF